MANDERERALRLLDQAAERGDAEAARELTQYIRELDTTPAAPARSQAPTYFGRMMDRLATPPL
jgi:TPR repeat protein